MEQAIPDEVVCTEQIFDISFHPQFDVFAAGLIDGSVDLWSYGKPENKLVFKSPHHKSSCRGVLFSDNGEILYTISTDKTIQAVDGQAKQMFCVNNAHKDPLNKIVNISESVIATGDDVGIVKLWDIRCGPKDVMEWHLHEDFVSGFAFHQESNTLLSIGGDARLAVYDIRNKNNNFRSDDQESELQSIVIFKHGRKVLCGTQDGPLLVFSWGKWGDCSDRVLGHPQSVNTMIKIDESTVITGSSDGFIRCVAVQPNKILGIIGDHETFPVEGMYANHNGNLLASFAHDEIIRFWDISMFNEEDDDDGDNNDDNNMDMESSDEDDDGEWEDVEDSNNNNNNSNNNNNNQGMTVLDMEEEDNSDEDDDDSSIDSIDKRYQKKQKNKDNNKKNKNGKKLLSKNEKFYADL